MSTPTTQPPAVPNGVYTRLCRLYSEIGRAADDLTLFGEHKLADLARQSETNFYNITAELAERENYDG